MTITLKIPDADREIKIVFDPPLTNEEFETLCSGEDFADIERTKEGLVVCTVRGF